MMKKMTSYNECGRTLTETLAMLAIVGILSVVGMVGYTSAMDKSRANTLIQEAQKRAVIVAGQIGFNNQTPSLAEFEPYNTTSAGTFGDVITKGLTNQFGIQVSNVNKSICQNILNTIGDKTPIRRLSYETTPTTPITTCKEDDDFLFVYNNDMTGEHDTQYCESDESCGACGVCSSTTHLCEGECTPPPNECDDDTECNSENECMICDTETHKCKDGCERVQYLETTNQQTDNTSTNNAAYIDTGIIPNDNTRIECRMQFTTLISGQNKEALNGTTGTTSAPRFAWGFASISPYTNFYFGLGAQNLTTSVTRDTNVHTFVLDAKNKTCSIDDTTSSFTSSGSLNGTKSIYLFARHTEIAYANKPCNAKIYYCKIYDNGTSVLDLVPVHASFKTDGKQNCMFNRVPEDGKLKLYCNSGTGDFTTNK